MIEDVVMLVGLMTAVVAAQEAAPQRIHFARVLPDPRRPGPFVGGRGGNRDPQADCRNIRAQTLDTAWNERGL